MSFEALGLGPRACATTPRTTTLSRFPLRYSRTPALTGARVILRSLSPPQMRIYICIYINPQYGRPPFTAALHETVFKEDVSHTSTYFFSPARSYLALGSNKNRVTRIVNIPRVSASSVLCFSMHV